MHRPVDPVETEVSEHDAQEYLDRAGKSAKGGQGLLLAQGEEIKPVCQKYLPCLPRYNDHKDSHDVQRQISFPVDGNSRASSLEEIHEQDDNGEGNGLIELFFAGHDKKKYSTITGGKILPLPHLLRKPVRLPEHLPDFRSSPAILPGIFTSLAGTG
jgi:hypothetical protein